MRKSKTTLAGTVLKSILFSSLLYSAVACQAPSEDLYRLQSSNFDAQISDLEAQQGAALDGSLGVDGNLNAQALGDVNQGHLIDAPNGVTAPAGARVFDVEQIISIRRNPQRPMLDLVFVVDDSNSMEPHQRNYASGMNSLTEGLSQMDLLDYRIAVVPIYDSSRYFKVGEAGEDRYEQGVTEFSRQEDGKRNFFRLGSLVPLKDANGNRLSETFATPQTPLSTLQATLRLGAQDFEKYDQYNYSTEQGQLVARGQNRINGSQLRRSDLDQLTEVLVQESVGPLHEEILAPLVAALTPQTLLFGPASEHYRSQYPDSAAGDGNWQAPQATDSDREEKWMQFSTSHNQGFLREKAHLGVIFITDVIDGSISLGANQAAEALKQLKSDDGSFSKITTFGVLHKNTVSFGLQRSNSAEWRTRHCTANNRVDDAVRGRDGFNEPQLLEQFLNVTRGDKPQGANILNICSSDYGQKLRQIADELFRKTIQRGEYDLEHIPTSRVNVVYRDQPERVVPNCVRGQEQGLCWSLTIREGVRKIVLQSQEDLGLQELLVTYQAIDPRTANQLNSGR